MILMQLKTIVKRNDMIRMLTPNAIVVIRAKKLNNQPKGLNYDSYR